MKSLSVDRSIPTPICDFVDKYAKSNAVRLHMPGHKGQNYLGFEDRDITEIDGADSLFTANGIISESEAIAAEHFGTDCFYSAEGSSLCIRAMLYLAKKQGADSVIAGRNAHKTFVSAAALLDMPICWIYPKNQSLLSSDYDLSDIESLLKEGKKCVYLTSPDYLGGCCDIASVSLLCKRYNALLLVDNAHGAYLKFLKESRHPIDLGADLCCDSAHKTLPVVTGGAYLHISRGADEFFKLGARDALSLFASTSPSYLILRSLDYANCLIPSYKTAIENFLDVAEQQKQRLASKGYELKSIEPLKITIATKSYGYYGFEIASILQQNNLYCEFCDKDFIVFMLTPANDDIIKLVDALLSIEKREPITETTPVIPKGVQRLTPREALFAKTEIISVEKASGRIFASLTCACPPAVMLVSLGEEIGEDAIKCLKYYGIDEIKVVI